MMRDFFAWPLAAVLVFAASTGPVQMAAAQYCGVQGHQGSYLNARYGFEVSYAGGWHRLRIGPLEDEFYWVCRDTIVAQGTILDLEHVQFEGERTHADSLWKAVTHKATLFCGADGVDGGSYCEGPEDAEAFTTAAGLSALKFYQTFVREDYAAGTQDRHRVGPYFAVDISQQGEVRALLLTPGPHHSASAKYADFVGRMANDVRGVESPFLKKKRPIRVPLRR